MSKELHHTKICKFTSNCHIQTTLSSTWRKSGPENVFSTACWRPKLQLWHRVFKPQSVFINTKVKGIKPKQDEMVSYIYKFISKSHSQTTHPWIVKSHDEGTFLALFVDNQSHNYDTECSNHHPSVSILRSNCLSRSKMKWAIYTNLPVSAKVRLSHPWSRDSQGQETFLAHPFEDQTFNYNTLLWLHLRLNYNRLNLQISWSSLILRQKESPVS